MILEAGYSYICPQDVYGVSAAMQPFNHVDSLYILQAFTYNRSHALTAKVLQYAQKCQINITFPKSVSQILAAKEDETSETKQYASVPIPMTSSK